jgi:hypothetical protein
MGLGNKITCKSMPKEIKDAYGLQQKTLNSNSQIARMLVNQDIVQEDLNENWSVFSCDFDFF